MLDLYPKKTIEKYVDRAGVKALGFLKVLIDEAKPGAVIVRENISVEHIPTFEEWEIDFAILAAVEVGVFDKEFFTKFGILTSRIMQAVAILADEDIFEAYRLINADDKNNATVIVHTALSEMLAVNTTAMVPQGDVVTDDDEAFEALWAIYPRRNGRKVGKANAKKIFKRDFKHPYMRANLEIAIRNYAAADTLPKDMERFMKNSYWKDWMEEEQDTGISYEEAVADCQKNNKFPISKHYEMHDDMLWYPVNKGVTNV